MRPLAIAQVMLTAALLTACSCSKESGKPSASSGPSASATPAAPISPSTPAASTPATEVVVPPAVDAGPPRRVVKGDGISIIETGDGQVIFKTTSLWNEPIETTYASCEYYQGAIPVLKRQISEERAKLLERVCTAKKK